MKIYPSKHRIKQIAESNKNLDSATTIPLAYIDKSRTEYSITRKVQSDFASTTKTVVLPNQKIDNEDVLLFDNYGNPANSSTVINRIGNDYFYYPNNMTEFTPLKFSYSVTAQKTMHYTTLGNYNINITCLDDEHDLNFTNRLSKIFVAPSENINLPNNIMINNNSKEIGVLNKIDYEKTNFVFIERFDGMHYNFDTNGDYEDSSGDFATANNLISYETFLDSNINTWIVCDEHYKYPMAHGLGFDVALKSPVISSEKKMLIKDYFNITDTAFRELKIHNLFENDVCPILIIEHPNRGFTIISSPEIFKEDTILNYKHVIYEVLMYVHCISYKKSKYVDEYISYTVPDFEIINNTLCKKNNFVSKTNTSALLGINAGNYAIKEINIVDSNDTLAVPDGPDVDLVNVIDSIECVGLSNGKLAFKLPESQASVYKEPKKPSGWTSIFYKDKIYYIEELHYLMETNIGELQEDPENKLFLLEKDVDLAVILYPFKSSKHGINIMKDLRITIPFIKTTVKGVERVKNENYALFFDLDKRDLDFVYETEWKNDDPRKVLMAVIVVEEIMSDEILTDMRLKGGGLPEDMPDNFNLLDIGHIYGRPYRQANTLVITLPKKYEEHKDIILEVIDKYKVAEDFAVLFFEDDETDGEI